MVYSLASGTTRLPLAALGGILAIVFFCMFTFASAVRYPGPFSPMDNWLSDLGTASMNPSGNMYFNIGCILTGISILLMMAGLGVWRVGNKQKKLLAVGQACGAISAFTLMLIGVFDEGTPYHIVLSVTFFLLQFLFIALANVSLWGHPAYYRWIGYHAVVVAFIDIVFVYTFIAYEHVPIWEWLTVFSALLWVALLAYNTLKLEAKTAY